MALVRPLATKLLKNIRCFSSKNVIEKDFMKVFNELGEHNLKKLYNSMYYTDDKYICNYILPKQRLTLRKNGFHITPLVLGIEQKPDMDELYLSDINIIYDDYDNVRFDNVKFIVSNIKTSEFLLRKCENYLLRNKYKMNKEQIERIDVHLNNMNTLKDIHQFTKN